jgi:group I intron endonuclease
MILTVYCHTNSVNGKRYVGITKFSMERRWKGHVASVKWGYPTRFSRAIAKYGQNAFTHEVLETVPDRETANEAEIWWIAHFGSDDPALGYNLSPGGTSKSTQPEARRRMSAAAVAREAAMTPEARRRS